VATYVKPLSAINMTFCQESCVLITISYLKQILISFLEIGLSGAKITAVVKKIEP
jgi:hypothetical protein